MANWPKLSETVVLTVNERSFSDWVTVTVKHDAHGANPPYTCRFTCSEGLPIAANFAKLQIKPGDVCTVTLAGFPAFTGKVMTRQVYYDAHRHHIEIIAGVFPELMTASVISKTGEWRDKTFKQIAESILTPLNIPLRFEGGEPPPYRFPRVSASPGENILDFLDTLARALSLRFSSNENGDFVLIVGNGGGNGTDSVTEGKDIIVGREIIYNSGMATSAPVLSQGPGSDSIWGPAVAHAPFANIPRDTDFSGNQPPGVVVYELPTHDRQLLQGRSTTEQALLNGDEITVFATVQGWLRPSGGLWRRDQEVIVNSPMLMMNGDSLKAKCVTFTQDSRNGTRTELTLCNPLASKTGPPLKS